MNNVNFLDPINKIVLEEMKSLGPTWVASSKNWHKVFLSSLKKFFFFPLADEKWTYWVFMQPDSVWPISKMSPKQVYMLRFAKLISHLNPKQIYVDKGFGIDPERPDRTYSIDDTAMGLKLWANSFENKIFKKMMGQLNKVIDRGAKRIIDECPDYYKEDCTFKEARGIFFSRMLNLASANALSLPLFTNRAITLLKDLYRV